MILRIRLEDGSVEKIQVTSGSEDTTTLKEALSRFPRSSDSKVKIGAMEVKEEGQTLSSLGLSNGSVIAILAPKKPAKKNASASRPSFVTKSEKRFDPFPELARDYTLALRQKSRRRSTQGGMSYGDLAKVQSSLHIVEPQGEGRLKRVYICRVSAERFQSNCVVKKKGKVQNRVGLLLGTVQRERVNTNPKKVRTSLSTTPNAQDFCQVAKVHALWEPPQQPSEKTYDAKTLLDAAAWRKVLRVANLLDLKPVGWIFTHTDSRSEGGDEDSLPVWGDDLVCGAKLQIGRMEKGHGTEEETAKFVTLAMDANSGATEAFQLSDVSVQMVAEGMIDGGGGKQITTQHPVLVDSQETNKLDTVLCLVNTAMLSQQGLYAGSTTNSVKKNGALTTKTKKALLAAMDSNSDLLNLLSDFNVLLSLESQISSTDLEDLCRVVKKWARGQKKGTEVASRLKQTLKGLLVT